MKKTQNLPLTNTNTSLQDAIITMSEGRIGSVLVVDEENKLQAILSDGDLRRALLKSDFDAKKPCILYASKNPKVLTDDNMLASDALNFIEKHKIQLAVIVNENNEPTGVLHIHDLIEAGIK